MSHTTDIIPEHIVYKAQRRQPQLISNVVNGKRIISREIYSSSSSSAGVASPAASEGSSGGTSSGTMEIPHHLHSVQTFEFLGFHSRASALLFEKFDQHVKELDDPEDGDLLEYCNRWVRHKCLDIEDENDDWPKALDDVGIVGPMRDALLHPRHRMIRGIQPLYYWLREMIETNFDVLMDIPSVVMQYVEPQFPKPNLRGGGFETDYTVPATLGGHINLFKSVSDKRAKDVILPDGTVNLMKLWSLPPTDFSAIGGLYFTHQLWVARHYSRLIDDACVVSNRRTIEIAVPLSLLEKENMLCLEYGDTWRNLIFESRRVEKTSKPISRLRAKHSVFHGPISHCFNKKFGSMKSADEISEKHMLQCDGKIGMQHVWFKQDAADRLAEAVADGKIWLRRPEDGFSLVNEPWN